MVTSAWKNILCNLIFSILIIFSSACTYALSRSQRVGFLNDIKSSVILTSIHKCSVILYGVRFQTLTFDVCYLSLESSMLQSNIVGLNKKIYTNIVGANRLFLFQKDDARYSYI